MVDPFDVGPYTVGESDTHKQEEVASVVEGDWPHRRVITPREVHVAWKGDGEVHIIVPSYWGRGGACFPFQSVSCIPLDALARALDVSGALDEMCAIVTRDAEA